MEVGNKQEIGLILRSYKLADGAANFSALLTIPVSERIPAMAAKDFNQTSMIMVAGLTLALESINLKRPMNENQIMDLAETIIDTAAEDNLAIEDLMLFLQKLVRGEYEGFYESIDIPKFMEKFEVYRQERHEALVKIKEEKNAQFKALGDQERNNSRDPLEEHFATMSGRLSDLKEKLRDTISENRKLKNNF